MVYDLVIDGFKFKGKISVFLIGMFFLDIFVVNVNFVVLFFVDFCW